MHVRRKTSAFSRLVMVLALAGGAAACSSDETSESDATSSPASSTTAGAPKQPRKGGSLTYVMPSDIVTGFDPHLTTSPIDATSAAPHLFPIFDALITLGVAETLGQVHYRMVESMQSPDAFDWTMKLRPGILFSDGTKLDAEAVKFNFERIADPANKLPKQPTAKNIASMEVVNELTLRLKLIVPDGSFPATIAHDLPYVVSPTAMKADPKGFAAKPVGAGAYTIKEYVKDDHLTLVRNPNYYGTTNLDELVIKPILDYTQLVNTIISGDADLGYTTAVTTVDTAKGAGLNTHVPTHNGGLGLVFNLTKAPFDDIRARQALLYAIDPEVISRNVYEGVAVPVHGIFSPDSPYYDASVLQPKFNAKRAQELFDELAAAGKPLSFTILASPTFKTDVEAYQAVLAQYKNVKVTLATSGSPAETFAAARAGDFQAYAFPHRNANVSGVMANFFSTGSLNVGKWNNPTSDAALIAAQKATDDKEIAAQMKIVQRELSKDLPFIMEVSVVDAIYSQPKVQGLEYFYTHMPDFTKLWLEG